MPDGQISFDVEQIWKSLDEKQRKEIVLQGVRASAAEKFNATLGAVVESEVKKSVRQHVEFLLERGSYDNRSGRTTTIKETIDGWVQSETQRAVRKALEGIEITVHIDALTTRAMLDPAEEVF